MVGSYALLSVRLSAAELKFGLDKKSLDQNSLRAIPLKNGINRFNPITVINLLISLICQAL